MKKCFYIVPWILMAPLWADQAPASESQPQTESADRAKETPKASDQKPASGTSKDRLFFTPAEFLNAGKRRQRSAAYRW